MGDSSVQPVLPVGKYQIQMRTMPIAVSSLRAELEMSMTLMLVVTATLMSCICVRLQIPENLDMCCTETDANLIHFTGEFHRGVASLTNDKTCIFHEIKC